MFATTQDDGLGIYVNEMQRNVNGLGHSGAGGYYRTTANVIPYGHFRPYSPKDARGFGDIPNDFEASVDLQYIPVRQGWYYGQPIDGRGYPDGGLGEATTTTDLEKVAKLQRTQTILQAVSTISIATIATITIVRTISELRRRRR